MNTWNEYSFETSYVIRLTVAPYFIELVMDFELLPSHPEYHLPAIGERACFRRGTIKIIGFRKILWNASGYAPAHDANQEIDWGCLDQFEERSDCWILGGDWGIIEIEGGKCQVTLNP